MEGLEYESHYGDMRTDIQEVCCAGPLACFKVLRGPSIVRLLYSKMLMLKLCGGRL